MDEARRFAKAMAQNVPLSIAGAKTILNGLAKGLGSLDPGGVQGIVDHASGKRRLPRRPPRLPGETIAGLSGPVSRE